MKEKDLFIVALNTLLWGGPSDCPKWAVWAANDLLNFYEEETGIVLGERFEEDGSNFESLINRL